MVRTWYMYTELARTQRWYLTCISLACDGTHSLALVSQTPRRIATPHTWMHTLSHRVGSPPAGASGQVEARESRALYFLSASALPRGQGRRRHRAQWIMAEWARWRSEGGDATVSCTPLAGQHILLYSQHKPSTSVSLGQQHRPA